MLREIFEGGPAATNGYLLADRPGGTAAVIDAPLGTAAAMVRQAASWRTPIQFLLTTHAHWDHILDNAALVRATKAKFGIHRDSAPLLKIPQTRLFGLDLEVQPVEPDFFLEPDQTISVGGLKFEIRDVSGHCPGSVALYEAVEAVVFTGDALFAGSIGRTDLPGCDHDLLLRLIREKLLSLPDNVEVLAGHGPATTIGRERRTNPFLA
jgi:glyoxylase-like metal-dependent hydrolase (beta-lactamase superfamily II)